MRKIAIASTLLLVFALGASACGEENEPSAAGGEETPSEGDCVLGEQITTDSGLKYEDAECGTGEEAKTGSSVVMHYSGTLEDGTEFDSSRGRQPFPFTLGAGEVIAGWDEGIVGMKEGGIRVLTIPPDLGYGATGFPPVIPPDATLIFEVELLKVQKS